MVEKRMDYIIECYKSAREEILFRINHRDTYLKLQLYSQVIIIALSLGIEFGGIKPNSKLTDIYILSAPISTLLMSLHYVEDRLIGMLSSYIGKVSVIEKDICCSTKLIENTDNSEELRLYAKEVLPIRVVAQITCFVLIPLILLIIYFSVMTSKILIIIYFICIIFNTYLVSLSYKNRRTTGQAVGIKSN